MIDAVSLILALASPQTAEMANDAALSVVAAADGICLQIVAADNEQNSENKQTDLLAANGFAVFSEKIRTSHGIKSGHPLASSVLAGKTTHNAAFMVAFGGRLPGCIVQQLGKSNTPSIETVSDEFKKRKWERFFIVSPVGSEPPLGYFVKNGDDGKQIAATILAGPASDLNIRLVIKVDRVPGYYPLPEGIIK